MILSHKLAIVYQWIREYLRKACTLTLSDNMAYIRDRGMLMPWNIIGLRHSSNGNGLLMGIINNRYIEMRRFGRRKLSYPYPHNLPKIP